MKNPRILRNLMLLAPFFAGACNNGSSGSSSVSFDATVTDLIQNQTADDSDPVEVEGTNFVFDEDETAFDDVLPPDTGPVVGP